ncbi:hypothetical protein DFH09DRAFT_450132 [Mycena vulgaris]|nr:hypothetical protein DFH09DRAFT_1335774 [Mycena vulgaris]KAJ6602618.1 hypothetical protein DFH09DRAFT_450132 [Mycena vulgaris]
MAGKRSQRFNLSAPRDTPIPVHLYAPATPASAIADRIFNDPESWNAETRLGLSKDDIAAWDVIEQFPVVPSGPESADFTLKPFTNKFRLPVHPDLVSPESDLESDSETSYNWRGVEEKGGDVPFITFNLDRLEKDKVTELDRMSVLWAHGNLFRAFPSPLACASAPASPTTDAPMGLFQRPISPPHRSPTPSPRSALFPHFSPLRRSSKSATWGILEYYGVSLPETPCTPHDPPRTSAQFLHVPSHPSGPPPPVPSLVATAAPQKAVAPTTAPKDTLVIATPVPAADAQKAAPATALPTTRTSGVPTPTAQQGESVARARLRPLPSIPPQASRSRPRTNTTTIRRLPPTPPPKDPPAYHSRPLTMPRPAPLPNLRHRTALSLS